jgi:hypothetical protein
LTLRQAAEILGVSKEAVRKRAIRGSLPTDKDPDGRVYVYLDASVSAGPAAETDDAGVVPGDDPRDRLIAQLQSEVEAWREEARRKDHIIAGLIERLPPQLEESSEPRESTETATEGVGKVRAKDLSGPMGREDRSEATGGASVRRPWWRRLFS